MSRIETRKSQTETRSKRRGLSDAPVATEKNHALAAAMADALEDILRSERAR